jgi:hypothetical protein
MYSLTSTAVFKVKGRGTAYYVESPIKADRCYQSMLEALGPVVEIDGKRYKPKGFEMFMPGCPVTIGEEIGIIVEEESSGKVICSR